MLCADGRQFSAAIGDRPWASGRATDLALLFLHDDSCVGKISGEFRAGKFHDIFHDLFEVLKRIQDAKKIRCWNIDLQNRVIYGVNVGNNSIHGAYG